MDLTALDLTRAVVLDTDEILQVAIISGSGAVLINELCRPEKALVWPAAQDVNGIAPAAVKDLPPVSFYAAKIRRILASAEAIVGYNVGFDLRFLRAQNIATAEDLKKAFDVMREFAPIYGQWDNYHEGFRFQKLATTALTGVPAAEPPMTHWPIWPIVGQRCGFWNI